MITKSLPPDRRIPPLHRPAAAGSGRKGNAGRRVRSGVCCYGTARLCEIGRNLAQSEENLRLLLIPKDADDEKSVILEIRAGAGGEEAALFAHSLWCMYTMYAARRGWQCETISENPTELGGVKEIVFSVEGPDVYSRLKFESGVHRVQRVPETETQGRIHTSTVTVAVMPEAEEVELEINPKTCALTHSARRARAANTSTRRRPPSA